MFGAVDERGGHRALLAEQGVQPRVFFEGIMERSRAVQERGQQAEDRIVQIGAQIIYQYQELLGLRET